MGRTDDVINVAGHRFSTGAIEDILQSHPDVIESAVFGRSDGLKGELPVAVVVLRAGNDRPADIVEAELVQLIRTTIGAVAALSDVFVVAQLPKTRSGKILRATMRSIANGDTPAVPGTIENPDALAAVRSTLSNRLLPSSTETAGVRPPGQPDCRSVPPARPGVRSGWRHSPRAELPEVSR